MEFPNAWMGATRRSVSAEQRRTFAGSSPCGRTSRLARWLSALILASFVNGMAPRALIAQTDASESADVEARALFQAGLVAFGDGRYENALDYFERAYELSGRTQLLFNIGTTADRLRQEEKALEAFERYLAAHPDAENRREVEARLRILKREVERQREVAAKLEAADRDQAERAERSAVEGEHTQSPAVDPEASTEDTASESGVLFVAGPSEAAAEPPSEKKPVVKQWWFWTILGVAAVGGTAAAIYATQDRGGSSGERPDLSHYVRGSDGSVIFTLTLAR